MATLLAAKLRELRGDTSVSVLSRRTTREGFEGVGERTIQLLESTPGRIPDAEILEALAAALEVKPDVFYEYPIAVARREAKASPEAARRREADALRKKAQRQRERQQDAPGTTPARRRRKGEGK